MPRKNRRKYEIWAQLILRSEDQNRVRDFFTSEVGLNLHVFVRNMHLTVYYAYRQIPGLVSYSEDARVVLDAKETRFMVMAPGGENPRPDLDPGENKVGIRVHKDSIALMSIMHLRGRFLKMETEEVLLGRPHSTHTTSAFGAKNYQPHITMLNPGNGVDRDLSPIGAKFREKMGSLIFDRLVVDVVDRRLQKYT